MLLLLFVAAPAGAAKSEDWPPHEDLPDWTYGDEPEWPPKHFHDDDEALVILT